MCAMASVAYVGMLHTVMPLAAAAATSTLLKPVPASQMSLTEGGRALMSWREICISLLMTTWLGLGLGLGSGLGLGEVRVRVRVRIRIRVRVRVRVLLVNDDLVALHAGYDLLRLLRVAGGVPGYVHIR